MAIWTYKAINVQGMELQGKIDSRNRDEATTLLRKKKLRVTELKKEPMKINIQIGSGVPQKDIARFTRQFSAMNSSGLPLLQCLEILQEQTENPVFRGVIKQVSGRIQGGSSLHEAMAKHPKIFPELYCHMVAAGEAGGILDGILQRLAEYQEKNEQLKRKIKGAMTYPAIVFIVAIAVVAIMLTFVVPQFAQMFESTGGVLPAPTRIVMGMSEFLQAYIHFMLMGVIAAVIGIMRWYKTETGRLNIDALLLKAPGIGNLQTKSAVARFTRTLGTLLNAGVSIIDALNVTGKTSGNKVLENAILKTVDSISGGNTISEPLKETNIFPPMVIQMINVGEKTGGLPDMLLKVSDFFDEEVDAAVDSLTAMIEPLIIVFLGGVIGAILVAMYLPMFSLAENVQ